MSKLRLSKFLVGLLFCLPFSLQAQVNHTYPRIGVFHFGQGSTPEWYAKFDVVIFRTEDPDFVNEIKNINPETLVLPTRDWNRGAGIEPMPDEWIPRNSKGEKVTIYDSDTWFTIDMSDYCPRSSLYGNKRFNEYLPEFIVSLYDLSAFDGVATDGLWVKPRGANGDIDLDRNGVNDYNEHGEDWVNNAWESGVMKILTKLRELMPPGKLLIINSGRFHEFAWSESNGLILELNSKTTSFSYFTGLYDDWMAQAREPQVLLNDAKGDSKDNYSRMRYMLGITMYGDGYSSYSEDNLHNYDAYYDEYDLDLGYPKGAMQQLTSTGADGRGVWVRFFDNGAVIVNVDSDPTTVTDNQIRSISGYEGPYYRFRGGQDPDFNDGTNFDRVDLDGQSIDNGFVGDAILLLKEPKVVISDIFVDSDNEGTSPGSEQAQYYGSWTQTTQGVNDAWTLNYKDWKDIYALAYTSPGSGQNIAVFTPTITMAGWYEIFEWHGDYTSGQLASDVPYKIKVGGSEKIVKVDQSRNRGRWNSLGVYETPTGTSSYVEISNNANGIVVADAIRFQFKGVDFDADNIPPSPPTGVKVR